LEYDVADYGNCIFSRRSHTIGQKPKGRIMAENTTTETTTDDTQTADTVPMDKHRATIAESKKYRLQRQDEEAKNAELQAKLDEYKTRENDAANADLEAKGEFEKLKESITTKFNEDLAAHKATIDLQAAVIQDMAVKKELLSLLADANVTGVESALRLIQNPSGRRAVAELKDGNVVTSIVDAAGNPVFASGDGANPMALKEFVDGWLATDDGKRYLPPSGDSGSGGRQGGGKADAKMTQKYFIGNPIEAVNYIREHGKDAISKLPKE